jgi:N-methylhydantoinase A
VTATIHRIAADIGGTFTDIAFLTADGALLTRKVPSTPDDYARAVVDGILGLLAEAGVAPASVGDVLHASTVATNAILEGKGARTALVTTRGFRDVLELRRIRVPRLYEPLYRKPDPLVPRRRRLEATERMDARGKVVTPLDPVEVERLADALAAADVEAVAVTFINSHTNPCHERALGDALRLRFPDHFISLSIEVLPEIREYERTSTTVINAYVGPTVKRYLASLRDRLAGAGCAGRISMMQSNGGILDVASVMERPAQIVESGPAAGVIGAAHVGRLAGYPDIITLDMGGTTAKASLIEDGRLLSTDEYEVGGGISLSSRLVKGGGYALKLPVIDVSEVGAGGGSIVWVDSAGSLKVGPQSAGATPGPACYGAGGTEPTVTDASVVLGYLNPKAIAGGTVPIDAARAGAALAERVAGPLGRDVRDVAYGVFRLANVTMMRAIKAVSTYRGRDPRSFVLFAFGGNGGIHAAALARELGMRRIVVPPAAGVFSALGLLFANVALDQSHGFLRRLDDVAIDEMSGLLDRLEARVRAELPGSAGRLRLHRRADLRYAGQAFELSVPIPDGPLTVETVALLGEHFEQEHERTYGHRLQGGSAREIVALRVRGVIEPEIPARLDAERILAGDRAGAGAPSVVRTAHFGENGGSRETPVIARAELTRSPRPGPLIVEDYEGTVVVPPDATARLGPHAEIVIELDEVP